MIAAAAESDDEDRENVSEFDDRVGVPELLDQSIVVLVDQKRVQAFIDEHVPTKKSANEIAVFCEECPGQYDVIAYRADNTAVYRQISGHGSGKQLFMFYGASPPLTKNGSHGDCGWWIADKVFDYTMTKNSWDRKRCNTSQTFAWGNGGDMSTVCPHGVSVFIPVYATVPIDGITIDSLEAVSKLAASMASAPTSPPPVNVLVDAIGASKSDAAALSKQVAELKEENEQLHRMLYDKDWANLQAKYHRATPGPTIMQFSCGTGWLERCAALAHLSTAERKGSEGAADLVDKFVHELSAWKEFAVKMRQLPYLPFRSKHCHVFRYAQNGLTAERVNCIHNIQPYSHGRVNNKKARRLITMRWQYVLKP